MNFYMDYMEHLAAHIEADEKDRNLYNFIVESIKADKRSKDSKYKELWFLCDTPYKRGSEWIIKACTTLEYHKITPVPGETIIDFLLAGKHQMKEDRKNGLKLW